jgi:streptomycin 6-kinase
MSIGDVVKIGLGAVVGGLLVLIVYSTLNAIWWLPDAKREGRDIEAAEAMAATNKAIG